MIKDNRNKLNYTSTHQRHLLGLVENTNNPRASQRQNWVPLCMRCDMYSSASLGSPRKYPASTAVRKEHTCCTSRAEILAASCYYVDLGIMPL